MTERRTQSEMTNQLVKQYTQMLGVLQRQIGDEEIVQRLVLALANEIKKSYATALLRVLRISISFI
jgi:hypothetical protein